MVGRVPAVSPGGRRVRPLADVVVVIAHPLLAAAALGPGQPGPGAAAGEQGHVLRAEGHAAHHPVHAGALVPAVGPKVLAVLVHPPAELAGQTLGVSCRRAHTTTGNSAVKGDTVRIHTKPTHTCKPAGSNWGKETYFKVVWPRFFSFPFHIRRIVQIPRLTNFT